MAQKQDIRKRSQLPGLLYPLDKNWNQPNSWKGSQKIRSTVLPVESKAQSSRNIFSQNRKDRNAPVLVVRRNKADY